MSVAYIDVGQTGMRIETDGERRMLDRPGEPLDTRPAVERLAQDIVDGAPVVDELHVGATGIGQVSDAVELARELVGRGARRALVASDRVCGYLGALGEQDGVTVTAGTGVVGFAIAAKRSATVGGVGWAIDDEGGGFWVGRRGLLAALRGHDGRGPVTALTRSGIDAFGEPTLWQSRVTGAGTTIATIAGFVPAVARAAAGGDRVAQGIWTAAAEALAEVATAAWRAVDGVGSPPMAVVGGLVRAGSVFTGPLTLRLAPHSASLRFIDDAALAGVHVLERNRTHPGIGPHIAVSEAS